MSNEFYKYIADATIKFFQGKAATLQPGERYCLKLDDDMMVEGVNEALCEVTQSNKIQGKFDYHGIYSTFTIQLSGSLEVVVASKINGMTDDFLATLRNAKLTENLFPVLMITSPVVIDTIISGTGDLSAKGMPFHASSIISKINDDIRNAQLNIADRVLLEQELKRKQFDRYSDKSSLSEYSHLLTVLKRGFVKNNEYHEFRLLPDTKAKNLTKENELRDRYEENYRDFNYIDHIFKHGDIDDTLINEFDKSFINHLKDCKRKGLPWFEGITYTDVENSRNKQNQKLNNPLDIKDDKILVYSGSLSGYQFVKDTSFFIRNDGTGKAKSRKKNILIYNKDNKNEISIEIEINVPVKNIDIIYSGENHILHGKKILLKIKPTGCTFVFTRITDTINHISFEVKICVLNLPPMYLENIQTSYILDVKKDKVSQAKIKVLDITNELIINPNQSVVIDKDAVEDSTYECNYNQTLKLAIHDDAINTDTGHLNCTIKCGIILIPIQIQDESIQPTELTGIGAFKQKNENKKSFEYREGNKIINGTYKFYAKDPFSSSLKREKFFIDKECFAITETNDSLDELELKIDEDVKDNFLNFVRAFRTLRTLPSLAYYKNTLLALAQKYVTSVENYLSQIPEGNPLSPENNDVLFLGCVIKDSDEIALSPLHPLNVKYQLHLLTENHVGQVRDNLIEKLSSLYLLPYIRDEKRNLYRAIEQRHSLEWRYYVPTYSTQFLGTKNFVQRLVEEKIIQYREHFSFLFDDIGNNEMHINLITMGDCGEVFRGLIRYYVKQLSSDNEPDNFSCFVINIYSETAKLTYNEFSLLSDQHKLREYVNRLFTAKELESFDINELVLILSSNIHCFYHTVQDNDFRYAHLAFYEMPFAENNGDSRMDSITTGISLGGITSGTPSVLNGEWYKTGFGTKYAPDNDLIRLAKLYNALFRVAYTGSSYEHESCIFTDVRQGQEGIIGKIYKSSNWVVFIDPKVDLSFFKNDPIQRDDLMIIHYSDQYTSSGGYDDITVTKKSEQYSKIISEQLAKKNIPTDSTKIHAIINLFNAVNGDWLLRLIASKDFSGKTDSNFSREKMSILAAIRLCMVFYSHPKIIWVPISLEEMLRVSNGIGLSKNEGPLTAKNLGFNQGPTCDDILLVGIEGPVDHIKVYLHPVEVKIGINQSHVIEKAKDQALNTYQGLWDSLWTSEEEKRKELEKKLSRNFFIQVVIDCCEKMKLYDVYPNSWDTILADYRENLLNDRYEFSDELDAHIGKATVISFGKHNRSISGHIDSASCVSLLEFQEQSGYSYMVFSTNEIEEDLEKNKENLPPRLKSVFQDHIGCREATGEMNEFQADTLGFPNQLQLVEENYVKSINKYSSGTKMLAEQRSDQEPTNYHDPLDNEKVEVLEKVENEITGMKILFGTDLATGEELLWMPNDTNQTFHTNTGIIGTMGTGKTQFTKSIITQLYRDQKHNLEGDPLGILIFDYKGDYNESKADFVDATHARVLYPYKLPFNPLALTKGNVFKPLLPIHTANAFKDTLSKVYSLGPKQQNVLFQCIIDAYKAQGIIPGKPNTWNNTPPTFEMVYSIYEQDINIKKSDSLAAVMENLHQFQIFETDPDKTKSLFDLLKGVIVIDLSGFDSSIQSLVIAITLDLFYSQMQVAGSSKLKDQCRQLTKLILVDEADNFMSEGFPSLKKILKEGREFGVGTILSTQSLKHFGSGDDDYSKYILTWVVHNVADLKISDVEFVFKTESKSQKSQTLFNDIKGLKKFHSIVKIGNGKPQYIEDKPFWKLYSELKQD